MSESSYKDLLDFIHKRLNMDCTEYNESYIKRRLNARIIANGLHADDYASYIELLKSKPDESRQLYDALTINVTQFFRDSPLWEYLSRHVFPKILEEKKGSRENAFTIWSCGCSSGEEPYSLAIVAKEVFKPRDGLKLIIHATDIDDQSLQRAQDAVYDEHALKTMPAGYISKYFHPVNVKGGTRYQLDDSIKSMVQFQRHNFLSEMPPARNIDMVFCRNVIIYFTQNAKDNLMGTFYSALCDHGWLVIGKSEVLFTSKAQQYFYVYNAEERVYRKERRKMEKDVQFERRKNWWHGYGASRQKYV